MRTGRQLSGTDDSPLLRRLYGCVPAHLLVTGKMKKKKDPLRKRYTKLRAAARDVWRYDYTHKDRIAEALDIDKHFICPDCKTRWPKWAAAVDHEPPIGSFEGLHDFGDWVIRLFQGKTQVLCKTCHADKTRKQR